MEGRRRPTKKRKVFPFVSGAADAHPPFFFSVPRLPGETGEVSHCLTNNLRSPKESTFLPTYFPSHFWPTFHPCCIRHSTTYTICPFVCPIQIEQIALPTQTSSMPRLARRARRASLSGTFFASSFWVLVAFTFASWSILLKATLF